MSGLKADTERTKEDDVRKNINDSVTCDRVCKN